MTITLPEETAVEKSVQVRILERAALIIEEHGHTCGALCSDRGGNRGEHHNMRIDDARLSYCELGAIWRAAFECGLLPPRYDDLQAIVYANQALGNVPADAEYDTYNVIAEAAGISSVEMEGIHTFNDAAKDARKSAAHLRMLARQWQSTRS